MRGRRVVAGAVALAFASGCAVGPNYVRPAVTAPSEFRGQVTPVEAHSIADLPWWEVFDDEVLQQLVTEAIDANYDLKDAVARVEQARALLGFARSPFYPQIGYQGSAGRQRVPQFEQQPSNAYDLFYGAFALAWELDVWGRIRRSSEAAKESLLATEEFRRGVLLTVVTDVAQAYLTLLELDRELEIAHETAKSFEDTRDLFERRYRGGVGNKLQVARAEAALAQTEATIPDLERRIVAQENAIDVLLGRMPGPIPRGKPLVEHAAPPETPPGLPSALLERRPDVLQAEHTVASANAQVGVAIANFFPRIGLTALYGGQSTELADIVKGSFNLWNAAGNVAGPLFQGFALLEQYRGQKASWRQTVAQYEQTVLTAFAEVSDTLTAQTRYAEERDAQERSVHAYQESVRLSLLRYDSGLAGYFEVLEAQQQLFPAELALAQVQLNQLLTEVTLYRALGGGWQLPDEQWTHKP
jgi:multidrug efflux system outer membrane protein